MWVKCMLWQRALLSPLCLWSSTSSNTIPSHAKLPLQSNFIATSLALVPFMFWYNTFLTWTADAYTYTNVVKIKYTYICYGDINNYFSLLPVLCSFYHDRNSFGLLWLDCAHCAFQNFEIVCCLHLQNIPALLHKIWLSLIFLDVFLVIHRNYIIHVN